jgi:hypothetical protein
MNSPLQHRKVRLRGLGGQTICSVPGTCASATGKYRIRGAIGIIRGNNYTESAFADWRTRCSGWCSARPRPADVLRTRGHCCVWRFTHLSLRNRRLRDQILKGHDAIRVGVVLNDDDRLSIMHQSMQRTQQVPDVGPRGKDGQLRVVRYPLGTTGSISAPSVRSDKTAV